MDWFVVGGVDYLCGVEVWFVEYVFGFVEGEEVFVVMVVVYVGGIDVIEWDVVLGDM